MTRLFCIMKIGGSAITDKENFEHLLQEKLDLIVNWFAALQSTEHDENHTKICAEYRPIGLTVNFVVVHGAGSFGHYQAKKYGIEQGWIGQENSSYLKQGFVETRASVTKLNNHVVSVFHQHKVPAISVPVFGLWSKRHGKVTCENVPLISRLLRDGMIPILHGDVIYDDSKGDMTILSGDTIVQVLCNELKPDRVLFISDVEGIYDKPPHIPGAQLLSEILVKADGTLKHNVATDVKGFDVTGGIRKKINSACEIVKTDPSLKVYICDFHEDTLNSILTKGLCSKCHGTVIQYEHSNETECS